MAVFVTGSKQGWSQEEKKALENLWPKATRTEIECTIPNRTWRSMGTKASRIGIKREILGRGPHGTFKQVRKRFSLDNFNDGYVNNRGRFLVWSPDHPRAYNEGYILRAIVAYEAYHDVIIPSDMDVHHVDGNRLNDSKENLTLLSHVEHAIHSNSKKKLDAQITRVCEHCGKEFIIKRWRLKDPIRGKYCSLRCSHEHPRSEATKARVSLSLKKAYDEGRHIRG